LTAFYELHLEEENFKEGIEYNYFEWLKYLWALKKNRKGAKKKI
jgi:hypothetical protein